MSQDPHTLPSNTNVNSNTPSGNKTNWPAIILGGILGLLLILAIVLAPRASAPALDQQTPAYAQEPQQPVAPSINVNGSSCVAINGSTANCYVQQAPQAPAQPMPMPQPEAPVQNNDGEISCTHVNGGVQTTLNPGFSANGGHMSILGANGKWQDFLFVDDKVVVFRNTSSSPVQINSTDGFGLCSSSDFRLQTVVRFSEGCDSNGCSQVQDVEITDNGLKSYVIKEDAYCGQNKEEYFCQ